MTKGRMEKQGEHFCLHFLRGCAILLYTDECISPHAIVAQLDRAFGSDPEGQRFESSRSHQEKPRHNVPGLFFFCATGRVRTARPCEAGRAISPVGCCSVRGSQPVGMSTNRLCSARKTVRSCCGCDREGSNSTALRSRVSNQPSGLLLSARFPTGRNVYQQAALCPENRKKLLRVRPGGFEQQRRRPLPAAETGRSCWGSILIFQSPAKGLRKNQQMQLVRPHPKGGASNPFYPLRFFCQMRYRPSVIRVSR